MKRVFWIAVLSLSSMRVFASDITLDLSVTGSSQSLTLNGKTNLPPKTLLAANLVNPIDQGGDGFSASAKAAVSANQIIQFGPFSKVGGRLSPGVYRVTVGTAMAALQPQEVQPFFGAHGGSLTGSHVLTLEGTVERMFWQTLQFKINPDGSITSPAPSNSQAISPSPNWHQVGEDGWAGGSPNDKWQKVQGDNGQEIYVITNGAYNQPGCCSAKMFGTYFVANLPDSDIVGAPQSVMTGVEGDCETRLYHVTGSLFFAGKNRSGMPMENTEQEEFERKLIPGTPFEKAFELLCQTAKEQK